MPIKPLSVLLVVLVLLGSLALLKPLGVDVPSVYADTVFEDSFESGDFSKWSGTTVQGAGSSCTVETLHPFSGDYNAKFYTPNSEGATFRAYAYLTFAPNQYTELYARAYFYIEPGSFSGLTETDDRFSPLGLFDEAYGLASIVITRSSGGQILFNVRYYVAPTNIYVAWSSVTPEEGRWYCLEVYVKVGQGDGLWRAYVDGSLLLERTGLNNYYRGYISSLRVGLSYAVDVNSDVTVYADEVVVGTSYIGPVKAAFGVISDSTYISEVSNIYTMFSSLGISYRKLKPQDVSEGVLSSFDALVTWGSADINFSSCAEAIKNFARTKLVISNVYEFTEWFYPVLSDDRYQVSTQTCTFVADWGQYFRSGDEVHFTGTDGYLWTVGTGDFGSFNNITIIAQYSSTRAALIHMQGISAYSGFVVLDLRATRNRSLEAGCWLLVPPIKWIYPGLPFGVYARWLLKPGLSWWTYDQVMAWMSSFASENNDIVTLVTFGKSYLGRDIKALFIGKGRQYIVADACIHGNEKMGHLANIRIAELLVEYYRSKSLWKTKLDTEWTYIIIPIFNVDGFIANTRTNARGVDLNRDFPPYGSTPLSEPESQAMANLLGNYTPMVLFDWHASGDQLIPEYDANGPWPNRMAEPYRTLTYRIAHMANETWMRQRHWGVYGSILLDRINYIGDSASIGIGGNGTLKTYAHYLNNATGYTFEFTSNTPSHCLYNIEKICSIFFTHALNFERRDPFVVTTTAYIKKVSWTGTILTVTLDSSEISGQTTTYIYDLYGLGKPSYVQVDGEPKPEGYWTYANNETTVPKALSSIVINWLG
ncbi:MAG: M14 family zinc carboxypeptidase, partial [Candidatus Bathyarchaeia archaeon]